MPSCLDMGWAWQIETLYVVGVRIFDPHRTVEELTLPELLEKESAP